MLPNSGTISVGTTPILLFELRLLPRKDMIISNISTGNQSITVSEGVPVSVHSGVKIPPGASYSLQPGTVSFNRVWIVSDGANGLVNYLERLF